jgi:two-component system sensor histidine kinase CreC
LSLARIEARGVENASVVDLEELAEGIAARERERGATVLVEAGGHAAVRGDPMWLGRAIDNLVVNARTHGATGPVRLDVLR